MKHEIKCDKFPQSLQVFILTKLVENNYINYPKDDFRKADSLFSEKREGK